MSVLRPLLSGRGRLVFVATALLLIGALVAAPSVSGARAAIKQFTATIAPDTATGGVAGTWTEHIKNCGTPVEAPCTASSTIAIGQVRITVPEEFRSEPPDFSVGVTALNGNNWTLVSYTAATGVIVAEAVTGNDKLASGESVDIAIDAIPECIAGSKPFPTTAVGGLPNGPNNQAFDLVPLGSPPPSVTIAGCQLASGGTATDPVTGQTETIEGDFQGHVNVTFGGDLDCSDQEFGSQWSQFHLPTQVNDIPADDFEAGPSPKRLTSTFPAEGDDSSLYLICYAVPKADHPKAFKTRGGGDATTRTVDGAESWVGILPNCYDPISGDTRPEPCVSEQFLDLITNRIVISVRVPPLDPHRK